MGSLVWLASYPKSGNTWLRAFLANLMANSSSPLAFDEWPRFAVDEANPEYFSSVAGVSSTELDIDQICSLRENVHSKLSRMTDGRIFVKTHNLAGRFGVSHLQNWDVTSAAVYIVRNPLDVCISFASHFGLSLDDAIDCLANVNMATGNDSLFVSEILSSWSAHVQSWAAVSQRKVLIVRYEDLLSSPRSSFKRIADMLELPSSVEILDRAIDFSTFDRLKRMEHSGGFREAASPDVPFFRAGTADQWRTRLTPSQVARIVSAHGEQMQRFGYLPDGI